MNLIETFLRRDPTRWIAGALAGAFAGLIALVFAMLVAAVGGQEFWFPVKLMATIVLGPEATYLGAHFGAILGGLLVFEVLSVIFGVLYANFARTNSLQALLLIGLVWGTFSWIFLWNLFLQSFRPILAAEVSSAAAFPVCLVFGVALTSVAFFDRVIRR
ncbi:MAG: hypothetical protein NDJ89_02455 [Oligoflexia bacterium]|nr:hypothetical protein [Oligoflexia bacterium]